MKQKKIVKNPSTIYISHRHADKAIADVLRNTIKGWCDGHVRVFQSSDVRKNVPKIGQGLTTTHKKVLSNTDALFLIYTVSDDEWLYCMWESGIATDPGDQGTKIVVFQCASDIPEAIRSHMHVTRDEVSFRRFTHNFHKTPAFCSNHNEAFADKIDQKEIDARSQNLYHELSSVCHI